MDEHTLQLATYLLFIEHYINDMPLAEPGWREAIAHSDRVQDVLARRLGVLEAMRLWVLCP